MQVGETLLEAEGLVILVLCLVLLEAEAPFLDLVLNHPELFLLVVDVVVGLGEEFSLETAVLFGLGVLVPADQSAATVALPLAALFEVLVEHQHAQTVHPEFEALVIDHGP